MAYEPGGLLDKLADQFDQEWAAANDVESTPLTVGGEENQQGTETTSSSVAEIQSGYEGYLKNPDVAQTEGIVIDQPLAYPEPQASQDASFIAIAESALNWAIDGLESAVDSVLNLVQKAFSIDQQAASGMSAAELTEAAQAGFALHPKFCNQSVIFVANAFGNNDLDGQLATEQISTMSSLWNEVDAITAQSLANQGRLVVAGYPGHTTVVTPGALDVRGSESYPMVTGGGGAKGRSNGTKSVADVWRKEFWNEVRYFTPRRIR